MELPGSDPAYRAFFANDHGRATALWFSVGQRYRTRIKGDTTLLCLALPRQSPAHVGLSLSERCGPDRKGRGVRLAAG